MFALKFRYSFSQFKAVGVILKNEESPRDHNCVLGPIAENPSRLSLSNARSLPYMQLNRIGRRSRHTTFVETHEECLPRSGDR